MAVLNGNNSWAWGLQDNISGTAVGDTINLFDGHDAANGAGGDDTINGGYGDDDLEGGDGGDTLTGDWGSDDIAGDAGSDLIYGGQGNDYLYGGAMYSGGGAGDGADRIYGGGGSDFIVGGFGGDTLDGGAGDDHIDLGNGDWILGDVVNGGAGIDRASLGYNLHSGAITFTALDYLSTYAAPGGFSVRGIEQWWVRGSDFSDRLTGWQMADTLMGGKGHDVLTGRGGDDDLYGAYGADTLFGGNGNDLLDADATGYSDWSETPAAYGSDIVWGGLGDDVAYGGDLGDSLYGEAGNDGLYGGSGNDRLAGGVGNDRLEGGAGADSMLGDAGDDVLYSNGWLSSDDDTTRDTLDGGSGSDEVWAGANDYALGGDAANTLDLIRLTFSASTAGVVYNIAQQGQTLTTLANGTTLDGFEILHFEGGSGRDRVAGGIYGDSLEGGAGNDSLAGNAGDDRLDGEAGVDVLLGGGGNDTFHDSDREDAAHGDRHLGGAGNDVFEDGYGGDTLTGDAGDDVFNLGSYLRSEDFLADSVNGGAGFDRASYALADLGVHVDLAAQGANGGAARGDTFLGVEHIEGSSYDDVLRGNGDANSFDGGGRDDIIFGAAGADVLRGGGGADELTGGTGADSFVLELDDSWTSDDPYWPHDTITDFNRAEDRLAVFRSEFGMTQANFRLLNQATEVVATGGPAFVFETDTRRLWFDEDGAGLDTDGDGVIDTNADAVLIATLSTVTSLSVADFSFYDL